MPAHKPYYYDPERRVTILRPASTLGSWVLPAALSFVVGAAGTWLFLFPPDFGAVGLVQPTSEVVSVFARERAFAVDGDTLRLSGERIRIVGLDAPETEQARCASERQRGAAAKVRLAEVIARGEMRFDRVGTDRYGRTLARVYVDGRDVARIMIAEGLAAPYQGEKRRNWCAP